MTPSREVLCLENFRFDASRFEMSTILHRTWGAFQVPLADEFAVRSLRQGEILPSSKQFQVGWLGSVKFAETSAYQPTP